MKGIRSKWSRANEEAQVNSESRHCVELTSQAKRKYEASQQEPLAVPWPLLLLLILHRMES